ncbi:hypothetical protein BV898_04595 [Hypsibius exemplaris]|uniref:Uncharacterized protein n=1 Tax=Hypsibius exemplaris TaxID=2072580 RepID=A0A1W0X1Q0_HYPEX|nr:hypothetical protein BV898_04595 [Hypsibius exemplaris]
MGLVFLSHTVAPAGFPAWFYGQPSSSSPSQSNYVVYPFGPGPEKAWYKPGSGTSPFAANSGPTKLDSSAASNAHMDVGSISSVDNARTVIGSNGISYTVAGSKTTAVGLNGVLRSSAISMASKR